MSAADRVVTDEAVLYETTGNGVAILTFNRPDRLNTWGRDIATAFHAGIDRAEADPDVRVIVLTGSGKAFCAGYDLDEAEELASLSALGMLDRQELAARAEVLDQVGVGGPIGLVERDQRQRHRGPGLLGEIGAGQHVGRRALSQTPQDVDGQFVHPFGGFGIDLFDVHSAGGKERQEAHQAESAEYGRSLRLRRLATRLRRQCRSRPRLRYPQSTLRIH